VKWWETFGEVYALEDKISFEPDGIVVIKERELRRKLDCKYVWVERVLTHGLTKKQKVLVT
jgi:hypothetical protein